MMNKRTTLISISIIIFFIFLGWFYFIVDLKYIYPMDWDFFFGQYEAIRRTILEFYQFPFWHPWHSGGTPLFAHIDIGLFSIDTLCVLIFGTICGLKISIIIHLLICALGMYFLVGRYAEKEIIKIWGALLFTLQGTIAIHIGAGHINMISITWLPLIILLSFDINKSLYKSLFVGLLLAVVVNEGIHYNAIFVILILTIAIAINIVRDYKNKLVYFHVILIISLFLSLSFYRLAIAFAFSSDYPREISSGVAIPLWRYIYGLFYPGQSAFNLPRMLVRNTGVQWLWHEFGCYIGIISFIMFLYSFVKGIRWWHIGAILTFILALNSESFYLPGYWLRTLPIFKSMWVITRWRFLITFFIILGACNGIMYLYLYINKRKSNYKIFLHFLICISILGLIYNQTVNWFEYGKFKLSENELNSNVKIFSNTILTSYYTRCNINYLNYTCVKKGIGLIYSYENMLGYSTNYNSARIGFEDKKNYIGEIVPLDKNLLDILWTPNKIFINAKNKGRVWINQNSGSYWHLNGKQLYPDYRAFEMSKPFIIDLPKGGEYTLSAYPPYNTIIIFINFIIFIVFILEIFFYNSLYAKSKSLVS
jgi:hypothetical protein